MVDGTKERRPRNNVRVIRSGLRKAEPISASHRPKDIHQRHITIQLSTYFLCDPLVVLPSPSEVESPWKVLIEVSSDEPDRFLPAVRLASVEALGQRLGNECYSEAMRQIMGEPPRVIPAERQDNLEKMPDQKEHGTWNDLRFWFTDRLLETFE